MAVLNRCFYYTIFLLLSQFYGGTASWKLPQKNAEEPLKWWQEGLIYQIYPRSHQDSDGDGIGDLAGIESRLDHFVNIGVRAVWISPIYESPMKDFGYDISNFTNIEPIFGTMDDFKSLSTALKERDIKLIMDFVPNHSSNEHPWFIASVQRIDPYTDYYVWKDPKGFDDEGKPIPPNNWVSVFGGSMWEWNDERQQFYLHQFIPEQPDFDYRNCPAIVEEMKNILKFWLDQGVDGFRMDAVATMFEDPLFRDQLEDPNRPPESIPEEYRYWLHTYTHNMPEVRDTLGQFRKFIDDYSLADGRERCMMTEATLPTLDHIMEYYGNESYPIANFPFNFEFIHRIKSGFNGSDINDLVQEWYSKMPEGHTANWLLGNHDTGRVSNRFGEEVIDALNMVVHLLPGASVTYYGEEIGMINMNISWEETKDPAGCNAGPDRYQLFSRDPERTPMQWDDSLSAGFSSSTDTWLPMNPNYLTVNVKQEWELEESHLKVYKKISELRNSTEWKYGSFEAQATNNGNIFGFSRVYSEKGFVVLANFGEAEEQVNAQSVFEGLPMQATVYTKSIEFVPETTLVGDIISTENIVIGSKHALIITF